MRSCQNVGHEYNLTSRNRIGFPSCICAEGRWLIYICAYSRKWNAVKNATHTHSQVRRVCRFTQRCFRFSALDTSGRFRQVQIQDIDLDKASFASHYILYRFSHMLFGRCHGLRMFQTTKDIILALVCAWVYWDNIISFSQRADESIEHVHTVLSSLHKAGATLNLKDCKPFTKKMYYLWHMISPRQLELLYHITDAIQDSKHLKITELKSFWSLCNVYWRFILKYPGTAAPLNGKLEMRIHIILRLLEW